MMYNERRMCCGMVGVESTLTLMTKLILISDIIVLAFWLYMLLILFLGSIGALKVGWSDQYVTDGVSEKMFLKIFFAIMFVLVPLFVMLIYKFKKGREWWLEQVRKNFHNYYFASMVFYIAFIIQMSLILATSTNDLSPGVLGFGLWGVILAVPCMIFLHWKMRDTENQHFTVQKLRTDTLLSKQSYQQKQRQ